MNRTIVDSDKKFETSQGHRKANMPETAVEKIERRREQQSKPKPKPMLKIFGFLKRVLPILGGAVVGGGSFAMGLDANSAIIFAGCAIALILGVEFATVKELKELFDKPKKE